MKIIRSIFCCIFLVEFLAYLLFILATGEQESEEESEALQVETNDCGMQCSLQSEQHQSDSGTYSKLGTVK